MTYDRTDPKVQALQNGVRPWWDVQEQKVIRAMTGYLAEGCPDWGERAKPPHNLCTFCALPNAARRYREQFFGGRQLKPEEHLGILRANVTRLAPQDGNVHTLQVFNAGSFFALEANPLEVQCGVARIAADHPTLRRLVVESRAELITVSTLRHLTDILKPAGKYLTVRIGVETQDDHLRLKVLRKGHTRAQLARAVQVMKEEQVTAGGYVLLNPAPRLDPAWAIREADQTLQWVLDPDGLFMDEAYFGPTCVAPDTPLANEWLAGNFQPATLWATWTVLQGAVQRYGRRVHLLPFKDEPPFLAVPSNHVLKGIPESLEGAQGCDLEFHALFDEYRRTMDPAILDSPPRCSCRPEQAG